MAQFRDGGGGGGVHHYNHNQIGVLCAHGPIFKYWFLSFIIRGLCVCARCLRVRVKINYDKNDYTNDAAKPLKNLVINRSRPAKNNDSKILVSVTVNVIQ